MPTTCSHGIKWIDPCRSCEIVSLQQTLLTFRPLVERAEKRLSYLMLACEAARVAPASGDRHGG